MNFTKEQIAKAMSAKSADELFALANEGGVLITEDEARLYFAALHKEGELTDDELLSVAGGKKDDDETPPDPKFYPGQQLRRSGFGVSIAYEILENLGYDKTNGYSYKYRVHYSSGTADHVDTESAIESIVYGK